MEFSKEADKSTLEGWKGEKEGLGKGSSAEEGGGAMHTHAPTQKPQRWLVFVVKILTFQLSKGFVGKRGHEQQQDPRMHKQFGRISKQASLS